MALDGGRFIKILIFCVAALILKAGLQSSRDWYDPYGDLHPGASALFVFGDSLADAGNNNFVNASIEARADFAPYGQSFFQKPTGRFSDGRTLFDFIGFSETVSACCGDGPYNGRVGCGLDPGCSICKDPQEYVYWDRFHPTERVQWMIAEEVLGGDSSFVSPMNLRGLIHYTKPIPSPIDPLFTE